MMKQENIDLLSVFLYEELNNLVQGWTSGRDCRAHNLITFCVFYCCTTDEQGVYDLIDCDKKKLHDVLNEFRYPKREDDEDNFYLWWHNQSRDITDHADRYEGKPCNVFLGDLVKLFNKVCKLYGDET